MNDSLFLLFTELLLSSFDNVLARLFFRSASLVALSGDTLAGTGMSARLTAFTTTHGVINGVHDNTAVARAATQMTIAPGFTTNFEVVLGVADDADGGTASLKDHAHFAAGHFDDGILVIARHQLSISTGRANHLGSLAWAELNVVDESTEGDFSEQEGVADLGGSALAGHNSLADLESLGAEDVTLLTVSIGDKCDTGATVGVVLDGFDNSGDTVLGALEVNKTIQFLVTTADITHGHLTLIVTATALADTIHKALFRLVGSDVVIGNDKLVTLTGCCGFNFL